MFIYVAFIKCGHEPHRGTTGSKLGKLRKEAQNPSTAINLYIANSVFYQAIQHLQSSKLNNELNCKMFRGDNPAEF
jgi:hypothetical protein